MVFVNISLYLFTKFYYVRRNRIRDRQWRTMSDNEKNDYLSRTQTEGNKRLDFRFAS